MKSQIKLFYTFALYLITISGHSLLAQNQTEVQSIKEELGDISKELSGLNQGFKESVTSPINPSEEGILDSLKENASADQRSSPEMLRKNKFKDIRLELEEIGRGISKLKQLSLKDLHNESSPQTQNPNPSNQKVNQVVPTDSEVPTEQITSSGKNNTLKFPQSGSQKAHFSKYFIFNPNIHLASDSKYSTSTGDVINMDTETGYGLSFEIGQSIDNFDIGLVLAFDTMGLEDFQFAGSNLEAKGKITSYKISFQPSVRFELNELLTLRSGIGLGFVNRHNHFETLGNTIYENEFNLLLSLYSSLSFKITDHNAIFFGYRFSYLGESDNFNDLHTHAVEIGSRFDF